MACIHFFTCFDLTRKDTDFQTIIQTFCQKVINYFVDCQIIISFYNEALDFNSKKNDLYTLTNAASIEVAGNMAISENTNWMIYHYLLLKRDPLGLEYRFIHHGISCLFYTAEIGQLETCNAIVKALLQIISDPTQIKILDNNKKDLIVMLSKVRNSGAIVGYKELLLKVVSIGTK